jgi:putative tricarboxylic transport membrane protein
VRRPLEIFRSSAIGVGIGLVPGVGASIANLAAYGVAKRAAKDPASYGAGNPGGVIASEGANSSSEGASMVSLLALGIPGGAGTAVLLGAFAMHNVTGGPRFISENKDIVYALIFGNMVQAVLLLFIGVVFVRFAGVIVKVPLRILAPLVMVMSVLGAYALTGNMVGPVTVVVAGILGWFMRRYGFPVAATVVGLLVGGMAEGELVRSYQVSGGDLSFVAGRPITLLLIALLVLSLMPRLIVNLRQRGKPAASTGDAS